MNQQQKNTSPAIIASVFAVVIALIMPWFTFTDDFSDDLGGTEEIVSEIVYLVKSFGISLPNSVQKNLEALADGEITLIEGLQFSWFLREEVIEPIKDLLSFLGDTPDEVKEAEFVVYAGLALFGLCIVSLIGGAFKTFKTADEGKYPIIGATVTNLGLAFVFTFMVNSFLAEEGAPYNCFAVGMGAWLPVVIAIGGVYLSKQSKAVPVTQNNFGNQAPYQNNYQPPVGNPVQPINQRVSYPPQQTTPPVGYPPQQATPPVGYPPQQTTPPVGYPPQQATPPVGNPTTQGGNCCPKCFKPAEAGVNFCKQCGTALARPNQATESEKTCPSCHSPVAADNKFCRSCGTAIN